jgi:hypothetical protein
MEDKKLRVKRTETLIIRYVCILKVQRYEIDLL